MNETPSLVPGALFAGRFEIVQRLGVGAFGAVFEARMQPMGRRVALKVLHAGIAGNPEVTARFVREARLLGELEHPHIVGVIDVGVADAVPFLVMDLLQGETLRAKIARDGALPLAQALSLFLPVCAAVQAIHERGVVHRDLKPDNIMLARQATGFVSPKVLDFGIAKSDAADGVGTRTNTMMGTPHYMSPEQASDSKNIDGRSDQWALAAILWEMVTGQKLFRGDNTLAILMAMMQQPIPTIAEVMPGAPARLQTVFARALSRDAGARFASVRDLAGSLLPLADPPTQAQWSPLFPADPLPAPFSPAPTPPRSRAPLVAGAAGLLLLAAVAIGLAASGGLADRPIAPPSTTPVALGAPAAPAAAPTPVVVPPPPAPVAPPSSPAPTPPHVAPTRPSTPPTSRQVAPAAPPAPATPFDEAQACLRDNPDAVAGNECVVQTLRGRAATEPELGLLATAFRAVGRPNLADNAMRRYLARYPDGPRAATFQRYLAGAGP